MSHLTVEPLSGRVLDAGGSPVSAEIELRGWDGTLLGSGLTDPSGQFLFHVDVPPPYELEVVSGNTTTTVLINVVIPDMTVTLQSSRRATSTDDQAATVSLNDLMANNKARSRLADAGKELQKLKFAQAWKHVNEAIAAAPHWGRPYYVRGLLELQNRNYGDAQQDLTTAINADPKNAAALAALGHTYLQQDDLQNAAYYLNRALALPPVKWQTHLDLAEVELLRRNYARAEELGRDALSDDPRGPIEALLLIGQAASAQGQWQVAADTYASYLAVAHTGSPQAALANRGLTVAENQMRAQAMNPAASLEPLGLADAIPPMGLLDPLPAVHPPPAPTPAALPRNATATMPSAPVAEPAEAGAVAGAATAAVSPDCLACPAATAEPSGTVARPQAREAGYHIRADVNEVRVEVTVLDSSHRPVGGLPASDFEVLEAGVPQRLDSFSDDEMRLTKQGPRGRPAAAAATGVPLSLGILLDDSGSMRNAQVVLDRAVAQFTRSLQPGDEAFIAHFSDSFHLDVPFTENLDRLRESRPPDNLEGGTALYDAVLSSLGVMRMSVHQNRRVLVVVTDGDDDDSAHTLDQLISVLQSPDTPLVYCVGVNDRVENIAPDLWRGLQTIAASSGGMAFEAQNARDVAHALASIARMVRVQYTLTYQSKYGGDGFRPITVKVSDAMRKNLVAITRTGYVDDPYPIFASGSPIPR